MPGVHWLDKLVDSLIPRLRERGKDVLVFNGGLSVSGIQHIGRLRGEVLLVEAVRRELEKRGFKVRQLLTLYTQDPWKGKPEQLQQFSDPEEARRYVGWPLARVPDPKGCHSSWVEHYWSDFGPYLKDFTDGRIEVVYTHELYREGFRGFIEEVVRKREEVRRVVNKYRGRKPYPEGWIPLEAVCQRCGRVDSTEVTSVDLERGRVRYRCRNCGHEGEVGFGDTKLNWRVEWTGVWKVLGVDFEPYGKDHATPGGSRDSCVDLAVNVFGFKPPEGVWYEWVSLRAGGREADMTSSGFVGVTPREWLEVAHPQILRFLYFLHPPQRRVTIDMAEVPLYYDQYYRAERIYFNAEDARNEEEREYLSRTYELSHPGKVPERLPAQPPYTHAAILAQVIPREKLPDEALRRLRLTGHLPEDADDYSLAWAASLVEKAGRWAERYAPPHLRISIPEELPEEAVRQVKDPERLARLADVLATLSDWREDTIKEALVEFGRGMSRGERREFYRDFYLAIVGRPEGPRAAPLLALLSREWVIERLREPLRKRGGG
ncbi:lysine--tRNA ligase [Stetteria hydrogenophila]